MHNYTAQGLNVEDTLAESIFVEEFSQISIFVDDQFSI